MPRSAMPRITAAMRSASARVSPAAGLTLAEAARIAGVIRGIAARGIAVLLIEHDMHFLLPLAHRVVVLNFGAKIAEGAPERIRADPAVMNAYLGEHAQA